MGHGRGAHDDCQVAKKKQRWPRPACRAAARRRRSESNRKPWNWMRCGRLWAASAKCGAGCPSNAPRTGLWLGCWAAGAPPRPGACGPRRHCRYHTDQWDAYAKVLPSQHHRPRPKGSGNTSIAEAINYSLRQRCGVLVRKACSFSKSPLMHIARIKIVIDNYNLTL